MSKVQTVRCRCGKLFAACKDGMQDDEWNLDVGRYIAQGCTSQIEEGFLGFERCECPNKDGSKKSQLKLELSDGVNLR